MPGKEGITAASVWISKARKRTRSSEHENLVGEKTSRKWLSATRIQEGFRLDTRRYGGRGGRMTISLVALTKRAGQEWF